MTASRIEPAPALQVVVVASPARAATLRALLDASPGCDVVAAVADPMAAERAVRTHRPAVVLVDLAIDRGGLEVIERVMAGMPTPIVVCGAAAARASDALAAGAVDVVGSLDVPPTDPQYAVALRRHLRVAARAPVITHPRGRLRARGLVPVGAAAPPGVAPLPGLPVTPPPPPADLPAPDAGGAVRVVVVGASTGGPPALATLLGDLPWGFDIPVVVVQHMADGFIEGLTAWLDTVCARPVVVAEHGRRLAPGTVHVAPAGRNLLVRPGLRVELREPQPGQFSVPGIDETFESVAESCRGRAVGVLLTGMGRDGAAGLRSMRDAGAFTVAQDEPTCVVYGMPAAAVALGAVAVELPLPRIAGAVLEAIAERASGLSYWERL